jgi:hypothetical protein
MMQSIRSARPGAFVSYVGVPHGVELDGTGLFFAHVHLHGGPAPVRRYLPELIDLVLKEKINPGKVFDLTLPLDQVAAGYPGDGRAPGDQDASASGWNEVGKSRHEHAIGSRLVQRIGQRLSKTTVTASPG